MGIVEHILEERLNNLVDNERMYFELLAERATELHCAREIATQHGVPKDKTLGGEDGVPGVLELMEMALDALDEELSAAKANTSDRVIEGDIILGHKTKFIHARSGKEVSVRIQHTPNGEAEGLGWGGN